MSRTVRRVLAGMTAATLVGTLAPAAPAQADPANNNARKLTKAVTLDGVLRHLDTFQDIADRNDGTRASGTPGYTASADYVAARMEKAGYQVTRQPFDFNFFTESGSSFAQVAPTPTTYEDGVSYDLMEYSGAGDVTADVVPIDLALTPPRASTSGCEPGDFPAAVAGQIALLQRGTCPFATKVTNAEAAGAVGVIVMNQGNGDPVANVDRYELGEFTVGTPVGIPAVSVSYALGEEFANTAGLRVRITAETVSEVRQTENVIAESRGGNSDNVVMAGSHLDSVAEGPGFNDNGSGSAGLLEVAIQMARVKSTNKVRFAWWGAEESNLIGSTYYVTNLSVEQRNDVALYLNFDMIGSPNYVFGVYDGDDSAGEGSGPGPAGSAAIEDVFESFFAGRGLATKASDFTGRSDYGPFIAAGVGIPAGGLFTGAEVVKTADDVAKWGGVAGASYDPCYHQACDHRRPLRNGADAELYAQLEAEYDLYGNVNRFALDVNADAIATAVITFANDTSPVNSLAATANRARAAGPAAATTDVHGHALR